MKRNLSLYIVILILLSCGLSALAEESEKAPLAFSRWKEKQILEARNSVVRLSNKIRLLKSGQYSSEERVEEQLVVEGKVTDGEAQQQVLEVVEEVSSSKAKEEPQTSQLDLKPVIDETQKSLERAVQSLQFCKELSVEDYFAVYLNQFKDNPQALMAVAKQMKPDEVSELLKIILRKPVDDQARIRAISPPNVRGAENSKVSRSL